jgi:regulator of nucleoside diphosphate kinase
LSLRLLAWPLFHLPSFARACALDPFVYTRTLNMTTHNTLITDRDAGRLARIVENLLRHASAVEHGAEALHETLDAARIVPSVEIDPDIVTMNSEVTIEEEHGRRRAVKLAYPEQADPANGHVSVLSPLGNALLGARVGEGVTFPTPVGERRVRIADIRFQPEAAAQYDL